MVMRIKLDSIEKCRDLCTICNKYKDLNFDVFYGRYLVDPKSFLSLLTLVFHDISIGVRPPEKADKFIKDFKEIGGYDIDD